MGTEEIKEQTTPVAGEGGNGNPPANTEPQVNNEPKPAETKPTEPANIEPKNDNEPKPTENKPTENKPADPKPVEKTVEPEIEYNFKFPKDMEVNETEVAKLKELSKESKLSSEQAQKFVDLYANQAKLFSEKAEQDFKTMKEGWAKQTKELYTDEQIGNAGKVAKIVGGDKFVELLETTGLANNPLVVGFLEKVSANYTNDKLVLGKPSAGEPTVQQTLDTMYPNTK